MIELELREILRQVINARGLGRRAAMSRAYLAWESIVGAEVARHIRPETIRRGILYLVADSGVWAQEISFARTGILQKLSAAGIPIDDLRLRQGTLPEPDHMPLLVAERRSPEAPPGDIGDFVTDERLRSAIEGLRTKAERKVDTPAPSHRR